MSGTDFLKNIVDDLEKAVEEDMIVDMPREFFENNFIPYLIGEKEHPNIWAKLAELTGDGQSDIRLLNPDKSVYKILPSIYPRSLKSSESLEKRILDLKHKEDQLPGTGNPHMTSVMANHIGNRDESVWEEYLSQFRKEKDTPVDSVDDDDDFEIIY